jgi:SRSO17 transposase
LRARSYLLGLLSALERKNGWSLAEFAGDARPDGMQRLLNHARWDADQVRDALRWQVAERLGDADGVLVVDDTGFEKKGRRSAGVQRQYTGTAGKITNCQIGVFCSYANTDRKRVLIDRELYLPESWFAVPGRRYPIHRVSMMRSVSASSSTQQREHALAVRAEEACLMAVWPGRSGTASHGVSKRSRRRSSSRP